MNKLAEAQPFDALQSVITAQEEKVKELTLKVEEATPHEKRLKVAKHLVTMRANELSKMLGEKSGLEAQRESITETLIALANEIDTQTKLRDEAQGALDKLNEAAPKAEEAATTVLHLSAERLVAIEEDVVKQGLRKEAAVVAQRQVESILHHYGPLQGKPQGTPAAVLCEILQGVRPDERAATIAMLQDCVGAWEPVGDLANMDAESHAKSDENWVQVVGKAKASNQPKTVKKGGLFEKRSNKSTKEKDKEGEYTSDEERQAEAEMGARAAAPRD